MGTIVRGDMMPTSDILTSTPTDAEKKAAEEAAKLKAASPPPKGK